MKTRVYLIGMMGAGKTTVGGMLSEALGWQHIDTDDMIEAVKGLSVSDIFKVYGEAHFRALEADVLSRVSQREDVVISTGGGVILNPLNTVLMRREGIVCFLEVSERDLELRMHSEASEREKRPLLKAYALGPMLRVRTPLYRGAAHHIVSASDKTPETIVSDLITFLEDSDSISLP